MNIKNIAIIGAGWSGLQTAKILLDCGYNVEIYERYDDVGGTWHPKGAYIGQNTHAPYYTCQFYDFDPKELRDRLKRVAAEDIFENTKHYCDYYGLYEKISFNCDVLEIHYSKKTDKSRIKIKKNKQDVIEKEYDFIISTQFNSPRIPKYPGMESFAGDIYHSSDIKEEVFENIIKNNRKLVIVGAGKAATDMVYSFVKRNYEFTWLIREMYWFFSYDRVYYNNKKGKPASLFYRYALFLGFITSTIRILRQPTFILWSWLKILRCPGKKHYNFKKTHYGFLDDHQYETVLSQGNQYKGEIEKIHSDHVILKDNNKLECDAIIFATGCDPISDEIKLFSDGKEIQYDKKTDLYDYSVIPEMPRLCFSGFCFLGLNLYRCVHHAAWILKYFDEDKTIEELQKEASLQKAKYIRTGVTSGNPIFDSSDYVVESIVNQVNCVLRGMVSKKGFNIMMYEHIIKFKEVVIPEVAKFLKDKTKS